MRSTKGDLPPNVCAGIIVVARSSSKPIPSGRFYNAVNERSIICCIYITASPMDMEGEWAKRRCVSNMRG